MSNLKPLFTLLLLALPIIAFSQPCSGSKGANIFPDGDFGSGTANVVQTDPGIAPGYTYTTNPPPLDGVYTLTNDMGAWGNRFTWLPLQDNSSDPNGYFMVVNASVNPGLFYEEQVTGLCENTTYEFTADLVNLITPGTNQIQPDVSFLLDNVVQFSTGNIPENGTWTTYGFTFTTLPGQTSLTLSLRNNAPGGLGNDLGIDNISFRACGPDATILPQQTQFVCVDALPITLDVLLNNSTYTTPLFQWQTSLDSGATWVNIPNATDTTLTPPITGSGVYYIRYLVANSASQLGNSKCRVISEPKIITVVPKDYIVQDTICEGLSYPFGTRNLTASGTYIDTFTTVHGCDSIVELNLTVAPNNLAGAFTLTPTSCDYIIDGQLRLDSVLNGVAPYTFTLDGTPLPSGQTTPSLAPGSYLFSIQDAIGCTHDTLLTLPATPPFTVDLGPDITGVVGDTFVITTQSNGNVANYDWMPDSLFNCTTGCSPITIQPNQSQTIVLVATSDNGCVTTDTLNIELTIEREVFFPNAFTPNGDGLNDVFGPVSQFPQAQEVALLLIYNRWGEVVYQGEELSLQGGSQGWDGTIGGEAAQAGAYVYLATIRFFDGTEEVYHGYITLLR